MYGQFVKKIGNVLFLDVDGQSIVCRIEGSTDETLQKIALEGIDIGPLDRQLIAQPPLSPQHMETWPDVYQ